MTLAGAMEAVRALRRETFEVPRRGFYPGVRRGDHVRMRIPDVYEAGMYQAFDQQVTFVVVRRSASRLWLRVAV